MKKLSTLLLAVSLLCLQNVSAALSHQQSAGWLETCWMEFTGLSTSYDSYNAYVSANNGTSWTALDGALIRSYGTYGRVEALGLTPGSYLLKVVPVVSDAEVTADAVTSGALTVVAHDRGGFAHTGEYATTKGVGAYNNDGTLKPNAVVLYVTSATARTVSMTVAGAETNPCVGLQTIIDGYQKGQETRPLCVRIIGKISASDMDGFSSSAEGLQIKGRRADSELNITIEGVGKDAMIQGFGFLLRNCASVELRNFGVATGMDDDISLDTDNDHIWVHHIDAFYGKQGSGDHAKGDGAIDVKSDSKHVTISYCHFWDTGKSTMCGMTSESGPNYITYHHNWFDHSDSRHARIRTMSVHMYNNYYDGIAKYGIGACTGSSVFMENNYFKNTYHPMFISKQGTDVHMGVGTSDETKGTFSGEAGGIIKSFGNAYIGSKVLVTYQQNNTHFDCYEATTRAEVVPSSVTTLLGGNTYNNFDTNASLMYNYTPDAAADVPAVVTGDKGAGRCQHGDFEFTFTDADNADYEVNTALRYAIDHYTSTLVGIIGTGAQIPTDPGTNPGTDPGTNPGDTTIVTPPAGGNYECYFTTGGPSNSFYTVSGNYSNSKGTVTYNGNSYNVCLKLESSTSLTFTTTEVLNYIFVLNNGGNLKLDGTKLTSTNGVITVNELAAGAHSITKGDSHNLYYINATPVAGSGTAIENTTANELGWDGVNILNPNKDLVRLYTITGNILGNTTDEIISTENLPQGQYIAVSANGAMKFVK